MGRLWYVSCPSVDYIAVISHNTSFTRTPFKRETSATAPTTCAPLLLHLRCIIPQNITLVPSITGLEWTGVNAELWLYRTRKWFGKERSVYSSWRGRKEGSLIDGHRHALDPEPRLHFRTTLCYIRLGPSHHLPDSMTA